MAELHVGRNGNLRLRPADFAKRSDHIASVDEWLGCYVKYFNFSTENASAFCDMQWHIGRVIGTFG